MKGKVIVFGIILLALGVAGGYYFATNYKLMPVGPGATPAEETQTSSEPTLTQAAKVVTPTVDESAVLIAAVRAGLVAEHGANANSMNISVSKIEGNFAQGGAIDPASVGGAMWLAAKVDGAWKLVWDGNGTISCESTDPYNFPTSMVPECWNEETSKIMTR